MPFFLWWDGEIHDVILSSNETVTDVYLHTSRGFDGETYHNPTGIILTAGAFITDPVSAADRHDSHNAYARFSIRLYMYHEDN